MAGIACARRLRWQDVGQGREHQISGRGLDDLSEDSTGFGRAELRTIRDTLLRPRDVLEAYMTDGLDGGGGRYASPLRLYLTLCGLMMLILFFRGWTDAFVTSLPSEMLEPLVRRSGKSLDLFVADADGWISLTLVPVICALYAIVIAPLLRRWDKADLGWRKGFRATFVYLNAVTIPLIPFTWFIYDSAMSGWTASLMVLIFIVMFARMGRGRWYGSLGVSVAKSLLVVAVSLLAAQVGMAPVMAIGVAGATFAP